MNKRARIDQNGFYVGIVECQESPLESGVFLIPANSAPLPAHPPQKGQLLRFVDNKWEILPDYTGKYYYHKVTGVPKIYQRGEILEDTHTDKIPPYDVYIKNIFCGLFVDDAWVLDEDKAYDASVPKEISLRQFHLALEQMGEYDEVLSAVSQAPRSVQIEFNTAQSVRRDWPSLLAMATQLGWTSKEIDEVFILGEGL